MFNAPDNAAGKTARCPKCGGAIQIPTPAPEPEILEAEEAPMAGFTDEDFEIEKPVDLPAATGDRRPCPMCGEMIQKDAIKCRFCGEVFDATLARAERRRAPGPLPGESEADSAKRMAAESSNRTSAILLFVTGLLGCFSPILVVYGIVFLVQRPYPFANKGLAIAGTILHGIWTLVLIASFLLPALAAQ
jgi:hypothetical protein